MTNCRIVLAVAFIISLAQTAIAAPVYRTEDGAGVPHYSSKPPAVGAKPAELPQITHGDVKLVKEALVTCDGHGGVNCQAGPGKTGSVVCYDGFTGAAARYRFTCNSPKLELAEVSDPDESGSFKVSVRNSSSVAASQPAVLYKPEGSLQIKLKGPEQIEPFGLAEFVYSHIGKEKPAIKKPDLGVLDITCGNCS